MSGRAKEHLSALRSNKHCNACLRESWEKNGAAAHKFVVLEVVSDRDDARFLEQKWMDDFAGRGWHLMNLNRSKLSKRFDGVMVRIPWDMWEKLKIAAAERGISGQVLVELILDRFLACHRVPPLISMESRSL